MYLGHEAEDQRKTRPQKDWSILFTGEKDVPNGKQFFPSSRGPKPVNIKQPLVKCENN
jgi:hypothetical protein